MNRRYAPARLSWLVVVLALAVAIVSAADEWKVPSFRARRKNPVKADANSIARGKQLYLHQCLSCHGKAGQGNGPKASDLKTPPGDLSSAKVAAQSDGALYYKITKGRSPMPTFETLISDEQRWDVVNYIRTLAATATAKPTPPQYAAPLPYRQAISSVVHLYLAMGEHLAKGEVDEIKPLQADLVKAANALARIDAKGQTTKALDESVRPIWAKTVNRIAATAGQVMAAKDLAKLRASYKALSQDVATAVTQFGFAEDQPLRRLHCPAAFDKAGASWLQRGSKPVNPYLGNTPAKCTIQVQGLYGPSKPVQDAAAGKKAS